GSTATSRGAISNRTSLDMDSAQIVNMALNLSESRRLASRRNASQPLPPRLAPLPDGTSGGSLRQHLQQQRRISRTISPKPGSRLVSGQKVTSPLQSAFDPAAEGSFRYHFSQSTMARAQKAKDYLELLAQFRKLVELVPPLKPDQTRKQILSPPPSPGDALQLAATKLGRPYNPLQYIRNRKVRARERKGIDGEGQGFNDVHKVTEWVDEVAKWAATARAGATGTKLLPPFTSADEAALQSSPSSGSRQGTTVVKPKRPRVDWVIDPADMIADAYWLEQGDNKKLVEDRHWRRVFPQDSEKYIAPSLPFENIASETIIPEDKEGPIPATLPTETSLSEPKHQKAEHEHLLSGARDRAQQKLRALKGVHHRHNSSLYGRDFLRMNRGSLSDSSDTDSDRRRARAGTIGGNDRLILEKQMLDMIAREQRDQLSEGLQDPEHSFKLGNTNLMTPEREKPRFSPAPSRQPSHSRRQSKAELSESDGKMPKARPQQVPQSPGGGRASLEVPQWGRWPSADEDTSLPTSPELRPVRDGVFIPAIGMDLSPPTSRPSSPTRNPFSKVRSIFRERSRERGAELHSSHKDDLPPLMSEDRLVESPGSERPLSPERQGSRSPSRKLASRITDVPLKAHRANTTGHMKHRGDESSNGLRGLFRGPRIDTVIRSGVSKVGDMLWRREAEAGDVSSVTSSDESETEHRGRSRFSALPSRSSSRRPAADRAPTKHYLDVMPRFLHPSEHGKLSPGEQEALAIPGAMPSSRPPSRRSSRFELLKPPRIDVQDPSPSSTPPPDMSRLLGASDASDTDSRKSSYADGVRRADARLNSVLSIPSRRFSSQTASSRHWSISQREDRTSPSRRPVSKFEVARMRTLVMSRGIVAMEIDRRARERKPAVPTSSHSPGAFSWQAIVDMCPDPVFREQIRQRPIAQLEVYPLGARIIGQSIQSAGQQWQASADRFSCETARSLEQRVAKVREKASGLSDLTRAAADEADEVSRDLVTGQRLKIKRVVDVMDKLLRRRRRRFRWVRRAGWLAVEWVLVGFMWYVWFVVMIARIFLGIGKGLLRGARWLLWL
ncbi:hypothetical protein GQ53DRAFT_600635, partial [Thozetella sp. PMI_491]